MAVTSPEYVPQPPASPQRRTGLVVAAVVGVIVLVAAAVVITLAVTKGGQAAAPAVPVIENIPKPNGKCTPAADKKIGPGEDLSKTLWFGWVDGRQTDMPVAQALTQRLAGREVRDAWYCPPRADW